MRHQISFIENNYKCSGLCKPTFFYISQPIENGPPERACIPAIVYDLAPKLRSMRTLIMVTWAFFAIMTLCAVIIMQKEDL